MKILFDTHTHTNVSAHAFSTLAENITAAKQKGLEGFALTNHAPALPDSAHIWHFNALHTVPREVEGIRMLRGAEANVLDTDGNIDLELHDMRFIDMIIASIHSPVFRSRTVPEHTKTWLNVIKNPYVDILGHSGSEEYCYDHEPVIKMSKEYNKCIEINNHSFDVRAGAVKNCRDIALMCKKLGAPIVVSSDAHISYEIGCFDTAVKMLTEIEFPEELIMNITADKFINYIEDRRGRKIG